MHKRGVSFPREFFIQIMFTDKCKKTLVPFLAHAKSPFTQNTTDCVQTKLATKFSCHQTESELEDVFKQNLQSDFGKQLCDKEGQFNSYHIVLQSCVESVRAQGNGSQSVKYLAHT